MNEIYDDVKTNVSSLRVLYDHLAGERPLIRISSETRIIDFPRLLTTLIAAAFCIRTDYEAPRQMILVAFELGRSRLQQRLGDIVLIEEYDVLRDTIRSYLRGRFRAAEYLVEAILRIDETLTLAMRGALWGHQNAVVPGDLTQDEVVTRLLESSSLFARMEPGRPPSADEYPGGM